MIHGVAALTALLLTIAAGFAQETTPEAVALAKRLAALKTDAERNQLLVSEQAPVTPALFWALRKHADEIYSATSYGVALELYQFVLNLSDRMQNRDLRASALYSIGGAENALGRYEEAVEDYSQCLLIAREIGDRGRIQRYTGNLAIVEFNQGNYTSATAHAKESLTLSRELGDKLTIAKNINTLGEIREAMGDYSGALETYNASLALAEELNARDGIAFISNNIGALYMAQGDVQLALQYLERSLKVKEEIGNKTNLVNSLINLGLVYHRLGQDGVASGHLKRALQLAEAEGNQWGLSAANLNLADIEASHGDLQSALDRLKVALDLSVTMSAKPVAARALQGIAEYETRRGHHQAAATAAESAVVMAREMAEPDLIGRACVSAGRASLDLGNREQARAYFTEAIAAIEGMRAHVAGGALEQEAFFEARLTPYQELVRMSLADKRPDQALQFAEQAKARVILDSVSRSRTSLTKMLTSNEKGAEQDLQARIGSLAARVSRERARSKPEQSLVADLGKRLDAARLEYTAFENSLYAHYPELRLERFEVVPPTAPEIAALLGKRNSAAIEFAVTETAAYAFVITARSTLPRVVLLPISAKDLAVKVERFRERLAARDLGFGDSARELYQLLLAPLESELRGVTTLAIVPDGPLWELPFTALQDSPDRYLIQTYDVFYAPSLTVLRAMLRRSESRGSTGTPTILAMGNPAESNLPHAAAEVEALGPIYGAARSSIYTGAAARKERFQAEAGKYRILHLATHGVIDNRNPMYSYVALTGAGKESGVLQAREMMELDLHADLVVLSGCDTARGELSNGEGIIGMSWALFIAGSSATLASSWKVDSESTMRLMVEFHRTLRSGVHSAAHSGMSGALRAAALRVMTQPEFKHPYFWAGFSLVGQKF